jgi:RNA polymerase sigma factor (sigma-70 family)
VSRSSGDDTAARCDKRATEFTLFHQEMFRPLANYSTRMSRGRADGENVVGDVMMEMFQKWDTLPKDQDQRRSRAYLMTRNRTISMIRRSLCLDEVIELMKAHVAGPRDSDLGERIEVKETLAAIDLLPSRLQAVLLLTIAGASADEIAAEAGIKKRSVDTYLSRARKELVKIVGNNARRQRSWAHYPLTIGGDAASERWPS